MSDQHKPPEQKAAPAEGESSAGHHPADDDQEYFDLTEDPEERAYSSELSIPEDFEYDPSEDREWVRGTIALALVAVLAGMVVLAFIYILISLFIMKSFRDVEALKTILEILFSPVVGLVGAVTGFYFGEKSKSADG